MKYHRVITVISCCMTLLSAARIQNARAWGEEPADFTGSLSIVSVLQHEDALNEAHDVELLGNLAYVAGKGGSIAVIDISDPSHPQLMWHRHDQEVLHDAETVLLTAGRLFLGTKNFHSLELSNPRLPKFDATLSDRPRIDTINGLVHRGAHVFAANKEGYVVAFDISDPGAPKLAGALNTRELYGIMDPHDVDLFGPDLVVVDPNKFGQRPGSLAVFRVLDEEGQLLRDTSWKLVGRLAGADLNGANRVQVQGNFAFVAGSISPRFSQGQALAKGIVVDLSDTSQPNKVATVAFPDVRGPNGLTVVGNVWFLAGGQTVQAYDISEPARPRLLVSFTSSVAFPTADDNAHDLVYRDGYLYVTSQGDHGFVNLRVNDGEIRRLAADRSVVP